MSRTSIIGGRWVVDAKGGPNSSSFEISVIRDNNAFGKSSYGWFDESKLLVSHNGGPCQWPVCDAVWNGLIKLATSVADQLNAAEGSSWK